MMKTIFYLNRALIAEMPDRDSMKKHKEDINRKLVNLKNWHWRGLKAKMSNEYSHELFAAKKEKTRYTFEDGKRR